MKSVIQILLLIGQKNNAIIPRVMTCLCMVDLERYGFFEEDEFPRNEGRKDVERDILCL